MECVRVVRSCYAIYIKMSPVRNSSDQFEVLWLFPVEGLVLRSLLQFPFQPRAYVNSHPSRVRDILHFV